MNDCSIKMFIKLMCVKEEVVPVLFINLQGLFMLVGPHTGLLLSTVFYVVSDVHKARARDRNVLSH